MATKSIRNAPRASLSLPLLTSLAALASLPLASGCSDMQDPVTTGTGAQPIDSPQTGDAQSIELALTTVPTGVMCVNVVVSIGGLTISRPFSLTAGASSATLSLGQLPAGTATLRGNAYNVACTAIGGASPSYVADPLTIMVRPGVVTSAEVTFRPNNPVGLSVNFLGNVAEVAVGWFASFARMTDGTLRFWGSDQVLGTQLSAAPLSPSFGLTSVTQIGVGKNTGCVLKSDGSVVCWGFVNDGNVRIQPTAVTLPGPALQIAVTVGHQCALMQFAVACWGADNQFGQLGNGSTAPAPLTAPAIVPLSSQSGVGRLALGERTSCVVNSSGHATCWGDNSLGQFGDAGNISSFTPVPAAAGLGAITDLKLGDANACAVRADGALFCWGSNSHGEVGDGTTNPTFTPKRINTLPPVAQIAAGLRHTCAVTQVGDLYCWGSNDAGQLGDGTGLNQLAPVLILSSVSAVRANGNVHTCAEMQDLTVRCWGFNSNGQLGSGSTANSSIPSNVRLQ